MDIRITEQILTQNKTPKALWDNNILILRDKRKNVVILHIHGDRSILYYFIITKTLNLYIETWKLAYLDQYSTRKNTKGSIGQLCSYHTRWKGKYVSSSF